MTKARNGTCHAAERDHERSRTVDLDTGEPIPLSRDA
jgi:hypothetical protein